jgi:hypothetical protein
MCNIRLIGIVIVNPPHNEYILIKNYNKKETNIESQSYVKISSHLHFHNNENWG